MISSNLTMRDIQRRTDNAIANGLELPMFRRPCFDSEHVIRYDPGRRVFRWCIFGNGTVTPFAVYVRNMADELAGDWLEVRTWH